MAAADAAGGRRERMKSTTDLYDEYLEAARVPVTPLRHYGGRLRFHGTVVTVKCFEDNSRIKELAASAGHGQVMVVDGGASPRCALLGDVIAADAQRNGWEGVVIQGCVRDSAELAQLPLGVMALGTTPRKSTRRGEGQTGLAIRLGDAWCRPGDEIFADEDGVLLLDPSRDRRHRGGS
jgi:regulator of ribonuclease activity A